MTDVAMVPFRAAAHEHYEVVTDTTITPSASSQIVNPISINAFGFLRGLWLIVTTNVVGSGGVPVLSNDAPWNLFQTVAIQDVNGAPIFGPISGFAAFVAGCYGGYKFKQDPRFAPDFSVTTTSFTFAMYLPIEINANSGLGSLPNQNAAATYKLLLTVNPNTVTWTTPNTVNPIFRLRVCGAYWSQPEPYDLASRPQEVAPPMLGTTQFWWSGGPQSVSAGQQRMQITRTGNLIRNIFVIARDSSLVRNTFANTPDPVELDWDGWQMYVEPLIMNRTRLAERLLLNGGGASASQSLTVTQMDNGIFGWVFSADILGHAGDGTERPLIPSVQSSRIEIVPTVQGTNANLEILVNDVAPAEINQSQRYAEGSATTFHPSAA